MPARLTEDAFTSAGLRGGVWHGTLRAETAPPRIALICNGTVAGGVEVAATNEPGLWRVTAPLPPGCLSDGAQTFVLIADDGTGDEPPRPGAARLGRLAIIAGTPLADDLVAEIALLRAEIELLKREFRRLTTEF